MCGAASAELFSILYALTLEYVEAQPAFGYMGRVLFGGLFRCHQLSLDVVARARAVEQVVAIAPHGCGHATLVGEAGTRVGAHAANGRNEAEAALRSR